MKRFFTGLSLILVGALIAVLIVHFASHNSNTNPAASTSSTTTSNLGHKSVDQAIDNAISGLNSQSHAARVFTNETITFLKSLSTPLGAVVAADDSFSTAYGAVIGAGINVGFGDNSAIASCNEDLTLLNDDYQRVIDAISQYKNIFVSEPHWNDSPAAMNAAIVRLARASGRQDSYRRSSVDYAITLARGALSNARYSIATLAKTQASVNSNMSQIESQQTARFAAQATDCTPQP